MMKTIDGLDTVIGLVAERQLRCGCHINASEEQVAALMQQIDEGLVTYREAGTLLKVDSRVIEFHYRKHEEHLTAGQLERVIVKVKSDLLRTYDNLNRSLRTLDNSTELSALKTKIELSRELRALKKDITEFVIKHSTRLARDHQNLDSEWRKMEEFLLHDACSICRDKLSKVLSQE